MINASVTYHGQQIALNLPDKLTIEIIHKILQQQFAQTFDLRTHIVQLFDPTIGEYFDLNDDGLKAWFELSTKEKYHMRLQIIRAGFEHENQAEVFEKIQRDIDTLFQAIENLQTTAKGIQQDFQIAVAKYQQSQQEKMPTPQIERQPMRYPAEDIRFKNKPTTQKVPIPTVPVVQQVPLVSNVYRDDDEEEENGDEEDVIENEPKIDIETPLLNVGEDFQAIVSIAVNPSYFFVQNTAYTHDLEQLAQSMNDYYSITAPPAKSFRPAEMSCCAARYSVDNRWYRARIKRYSSDTTVELVYLDYGNNEERTVDELRPLDVTFARLPAQAICAALELLPTNGDNNSSWSKKASFKFHEDTLTKPLDVRIIAQPTLQWPMYFVQLTIDEHTDVAETLITLRHARRASLAEIVQVIAPRLDLNDYASYNLPRDILKQVTDQVSLSRQPPPPLRQQQQQQSKLNINKPSNGIKSRLTAVAITLPSTNLNLTDNVGSCTITSITSPSHFFIQLTEKNQFEQIYNGVNSTYLERISCDRMTRLRTFAVNTLGVARNNRDQRFYRVQIINHDREHRSLLVLCIDIGEYINIQEISLYELIPEYQIHPPQAIKCSLGLIHPVNDDWGREAINLMNRFTGGKGYKTFRFYSLSASTQAIKLIDPPLPIILYDTNTSPNSINEQLIERKLATAESTYLDYIRIANDAMNDVNGFKNQRIRQYIESQRNYTQPTTTNNNNISSSVFIERNPVDVRYEQPQKLQTSKPPPTNVEPLPLPEDDENLPYCPPVIEPEVKHWYAIEVTHVKSAGEFYIRYPFGTENSLGQGIEPAPYPQEIEPNQMLNDLHRNMADLYTTEQRRGITTAASYTRGQMVAVRYQSQWYRARVLEFKPTTNFAWIQFVDQGEIRELGTNTMRPLHSKFLDLPLQAYLCHLDGFDVEHPWTPQDKDLFKKKIRDKIIYARKTREPNFVQLVEFVDGEAVSFDSYWNTLHHSTKSSDTPTKALQRPVRQSQPTYIPEVAPPPPQIRNIQPVLPGIVNYGSGSEYSQTSSMLPKSSTMKKSSGVTIPPPPPSTTNRQPMQFISAGFKQPVEYAHLSPSEQLAQVQQQEGHRIQPTTGGYSINKYFRQQQP